MGQVLRRLRSTLVALLGIIAVTFACYRIIHVNATGAALALLLAILFTGTYAKLFETILAAIVATLCLDYFFIAPIGSITVADPQGWTALIVFLTVSVLATNLSTRVRNQHDELTSRQREVEKLYALSRAMLLGRGAEDVRRLMVNKCIELFGFSEVALFESATGRIHRSQTESSISDEKLRQVALSGSVNHDEASEATIIPVNLGNKSLGSLAFGGLALPEATLQSLGNTLALGLAQTQAQEAATRAEAIRKSEELKSMMIDALAHDLKTPLTVMQAAAGTLVQSSMISAEQRRDLLEVIQQEALGLERMLAEAIHLARIDAKRLKLECQPLEVSELIQSALALLAEQVASHPIKIELPADLPLVFADKELISQALKQLIDNAAKYSAQGSTITISGTETNGILSISVRDQGPGLTEIEQGRVFDKFYRGRHDGSSVQGTGMGLAIAKEISEAHGGSMSVESQLGQGSRFTMNLHAAVPEPVGLEQQHA
jgi:two-component system sensor histidine kinase KdpD